MNKIDELKVLLNNAKSKAEKLEKAEDIEKAIENIKDLRAQIKIIEMGEEIENKHKGDFIKALANKAMGRLLTEAENALLVDGSNGENYLLPKEISTVILEKIEMCNSLRPVLGYMATDKTSGTIPAENFDNIVELQDFEDGVAIDEISDVSFKSIPFKLKQKAGFIKVSNAIFNLDGKDLTDYLAGLYARRSTIAENKMGIEALILNKTIRSLADGNALITSINTDIDSSERKDTVIVTNQDGFNKLNSSVDTNGNKLVTQNLMNPKEKLLDGSYPILVLDDIFLPTTLSKAPIFYGDLKAGVKIIDLNGQKQFDISNNNVITNTVITRYIELIDVVQCNNSDKCYIAGELAL